MSNPVYLVQRCAHDHNEKICRGTHLIRGSYEHEVTRECLTVEIEPCDECGETPPPEEIRKIQTRVKIAAYQVED